MGMTNPQMDFNLLAQVFAELLRPPHPSLASPHTEKSIIKIDYFKCIVLVMIETKSFSRCSKVKRVATLSSGKTISSLREMFYH